jgi:tRNA pseudouridine38-40 synthase
MRIAVKFAYDGKNFHGYARQPKLKTVEGELIKFLVKYGFIEDIKESIFRSASRTDKGVSALSNIIVFNTDSSKKQILNCLSNGLSEILIYGIKEVELGFNPRHAKMRRYSYYLQISNLDIEKIVTTSACFTGENNFSNFVRLESFKNPVRTIDNIIITHENNFLKIDFYAQSFLWHQIRRIISALIKIGIGKFEKEQINVALVNPEKKVDFGLAPAEPLILKDIMYDFNFEIEKTQFEKIKKLKEQIISSI